MIFQTDSQVFDMLFDASGEMAIRPMNDNILAVALLQPARFLIAEGIKVEIAEGGEMPIGQFFGCLVFLNRRLAGANWRS